MSAVTGLDIIYGEKTQPPTGYSKIPVDLNSGAGGEYVYLCYTTAGSSSPITNIQVFAGDSSEFPIQTGYTKITKDLNKGAGGHYIYVCFTRDCAFPPVRQVNVIQGGTRHTHPPTSHWVRIDQDCQEGAGGKFSYVTFRYN